MSNDGDGVFIYDDHIDYDHLITASMHWLIRKVLSEVAVKGFPSDHHLYISFDTTDPEVKIPDELRQRYPEEMTIVLQNRFYDLVVTEHDFAVSLSFSRVPHRLQIPFMALTRFYDPSCGFVLQLGHWGDETEQPEHAQEQDQMEIPSDRAWEERSLLQPEEAEGAASLGTENVVSLDKFRKK